MQRLLRPTILTLSLAAPTASLALGLGDIRVDSALHQPLVAQLELVGATDDDLGRLSATIASDELFRRYNLERQPFIYGTTLAIGRDAQGRPVLNMRSTERFTEPVVTLLVDLHTPNGELVREYTLFLDPAGLMPSTPAASNKATASNSVAAAGSVMTPPAGAPAGVESRSPAPAPAATGERSNLLGQTYTVARRDTLDHIVTAAGAGSRTERHRMMIAIFRANPSAFQNNFNRLHTGATLKFPTAGQLAAMSVEETNHEYDAQMAAWRTSRSASAGAQLSPASLVAASKTASAITTASASATTTVSATNTASASNNTSTTNTKGASVSDAVKSAIASSNAANRAATTERLPTDRAALKQRIASLEQSLAEVQQQLKQPLVVRAAPRSAAQTVPDRGTAAASAPYSTSALATVATSAHYAASAPNTASTPVIAASPAPNTASVSVIAQPAAGPRVAGSGNIATRAFASAAASQSAGLAATAEATGDDEQDDAPASPRSRLQLIAAAVGIGLLFFAGAWFFVRRRNSFAYQTSPKHKSSSAEAVSGAEGPADADATVEFMEPSHSLPQTAAIVRAPAQAGKADREPKSQPAQNGGKSESSWFEDSFSTPITDLLNDSTVSLAAQQTAELTAIGPTVKLPTRPSDEATDTEVLVAPELAFVGDTAEQKFSFFNPEATTNTEHVVMGSALNEPKSYNERRRNPADVLRQAIEREPDRSDLRLKLLELYYTAAAENRRAFLDASRQLAKAESLASPEDWSRIADMGRIIAPDDEMFSGELDDKRVA